MTLLISGNFFVRLACSFNAGSLSFLFSKSRPRICSKTDRILNPTDRKTKRIFYARKNVVQGRLIHSIDFVDISCLAFTIVHRCRVKSRAVCRDAGCCRSMSRPGGGEVQVAGLCDYVQTWWGPLRLSQLHFTTAQTLDREAVFRIRIQGSSGSGSMGLRKDLKCLSNTQ